MATENGYPFDTLKWLDPIEGPTRHELKGAARLECLKDNLCKTGKLNIKKEDCVFLKGAYTPQ